MDKDFNTGLPFMSPKDLSLASHNLIIIDCRFDYEYKSGHIKGAIHFESPLEMIEFFFNQIQNNKIFVFYCEFSQKRGPTMTSFFREYDRKHNSQNYPFLHYPEVFILKGGFQNIWMNYNNYCIGFYLPMNNYAVESAKSMTKFDSYFNKRKNNQNQLTRLSLTKIFQNFEINSDILV
jgi:rhodanese-related sulfurtransferase